MGIPALTGKSRPAADETCPIVRSIPGLARARSRARTCTAAQAPQQYPAGIQGITQRTVDRQRLAFRLGGDQFRGQRDECESARSVRERSEQKGAPRQVVEVRPAQPSAREGRSLVGHRAGIGQSIARDAANAADSALPRAPPPASPAAARAARDCCATPSVRRAADWPHRSASHTSHRRQSAIGRAQQRSVAAESCAQRVQCIGPDERHLPWHRLERQHLSTRGAAAMSPAAATITSGARATGSPRVPAHQPVVANALERIGGRLHELRSIGSSSSARMKCGGEMSRPSGHHRPSRAGSRPRRRAACSAGIHSTNSRGRRSAVSADRQRSASAASTTWKKPSRCHTAAPACSPCRRDPLERVRGGSAARARQARQQVVVDGELRMHQAPWQRRRAAARSSRIDHADAPAASRQSVRAGRPGQPGADDDGAALADVSASAARVAAPCSAARSARRASAACSRSRAAVRCRSPPPQALRARHAPCTRWRVRQSARASRAIDRSSAASHISGLRSGAKPSRKIASAPRRSSGASRPRITERERQRDSPLLELAPMQARDRERPLRGELRCRSPAVRAAPPRRMRTPAADDVRSRRSAAGRAAPDRRATPATSRGS